SGKADRLFVEIVQALAIRSKEDALAVRGPHGEAVERWRKCESRGNAVAAGISDPDISIVRHRPVERDLMIVRGEFEIVRAIRVDRTHCADIAPRAIEPHEPSLAGTGRSMCDDPGRYRKCPGIDPGVKPDGICDRDRISQRKRREVDSTRDERTLIQIEDVT